jgi:hypothetical protein
MVGLMRSIDCIDIALDLAGGPEHTWVAQSADYSCWAKRLVDRTLGFKERIDADAYFSSHP